MIFSTWTSSLIPGSCFWVVFYNVRRCSAWILCFRSNRIVRLGLGSSLPKSQKERYDGYICNIWLYGIIYTSNGYNVEAGGFHRERRSWKWSTNGGDGDVGRSRNIREYYIPNIFKARALIASFLFKRRGPLRGVAPNRRIDLRKAYVPVFGTDSTLIDRTSIYTS